MNTTNKVTVKFGSNRTTATIIFSNGSESEIYESKQEVLHALPGMIASKKITEEEAMEIAKTVIYEKNLPAAPEDNPIGDILDMLFGGGLGFAGMGISLGMFPAPRDLATTIMAHKIFSNLMNSKEEIKTPVFGICPCGKHGMIMFDKKEGKLAISGIITSKEDAYAYITKYKKDNTIAPEDEKNLLAGIASCSLPETKKEKVS